MRKHDERSHRGATAARRLRSGDEPRAAAVVGLQRTVGNAAVAGLLQRNGESEEVLTDLATPQVREGPAIEVQKNLVTGLEANIAAVIKSDAEKKSAYDEATKKQQKDYKVWAEDWGGFGWRWIRGPEPPLPTAPFGAGRRQQVVEDDAAEFNLGGLLIDSLPEYRKKDYEGFYRGLAERVRLVPLDSRVQGARSSGAAVPEVVAGLAPLVIENTLRTMIDASQFKYLRAAGLPNAQWKILVEVHYIRSRPKDMAGFHKDTHGQTLFVNLNYHVGEHSLRGPEYVLNPPRSEQHDQRIFGTGGKPATLPKQFTDDLTHARGQLGDPTEIRSSGTVQPYGYVAFVDEAVHHATPFFENRYVTPAELKEYLRRTDKAKLDEIVGAKEKNADVDPSVIGADEVDKWTAWWKMITNPQKDARYTRLHFAATLPGEQFDRMLENVGAEERAGRLHGGAGGWFAASIPGDGRSPLHAKDKPPLVRQASNADLSKTWPRQLPEDVPRRFLRTWVRAVPETMAAQLRNLH